MGIFSAEIPLSYFPVRVCRAEQRYNDLSCNEYGKLAREVLRDWRATIGECSISFLQASIATVSPPDVPGHDISRTCKELNDAVVCILFTKAPNHTSKSFVQQA